MSPRTETLPEIAMPSGSPIVDEMARANLRLKAGGGVRPVYFDLRVVRGQATEEAVISYYRDRGFEVTVHHEVGPCGAIEIKRRP